MAPFHVETVDTILLDMDVSMAPYADILSKHLSRHRMDLLTVVTL